MSNTERTDIQEESATNNAPLERTLRARFRAVQSASERRTIMRLARELRRLPPARSRAVWEVSAGVAGVSLRASVELLHVAPEVAQILDAEELRAWGELARRLTMAETETGVQFIAGGIGEVEMLPRAARLLLFEVCTRQVTLSSSIALETFRRAPEIAKSVAENIRSEKGAIQNDDGARLLSEIYAVASIIAQRSAKHSADFLHATPRALTQLAKVKMSFKSDNCGLRIADCGFENQKPLRRAERPDNPQSAIRNPQSKGLELYEEALRLAETFALRAGGVASDLWTVLPSALAELTTDAARRLFAAAREFLERGGATALQVFVAGGEVLRRTPEAFDEWLDLLRAVGEQGGGAGNATAVALARTSPTFFRAFAISRRASHTERKQLVETITRVIAAAREVARVDAEAAIACFRSGAATLGSLGANIGTPRASSVEAFERWARQGLQLAPERARARRSYYALETKHSHENLRGVKTDDDVDDNRAELLLEQVAPTLKLYVEALTGRALGIAPLAVVPQEAKIGDGRVIQLPASVAEFENENLNFKLYKVLAAHAAGQIEFGTRLTNDGSNETVDLRAAFEAIAETYAPENVDASDAFSLGGYIAPVTSGERALSPEEELRHREDERKHMPKDADYRATLNLFPHAALAARIFTTLENGRIDYRLRRAYRGLARDLDFVREHLRVKRPRIAGLPLPLVPFELLFQITLCGGALDDARMLYAQVVVELETIVAEYLMSAQASVGDALMATSRVYSLFQSVAPNQATQDEQQGEDGDVSEGEQDASSADAQTQVESDESKERNPREREQKFDASDLFNAWANPASFDVEPDELYGAEQWSHYDMPEQDLEAGDVAYNYDEWDRELADARVGWCRVIEKRVRRGDRSFVELTRSRYKGVISSIRHQFQLLKPESLLRVKNEVDGDDYDLDAVINYVADRRSDGQQSERIYTKRLRRERDVAVAFLLDQSSSTARTIARNPLQPYTNPGRRIIDIEKEGLVLMSEALDAVGDAYAIYGFTSEGRRNVKFYVVKNFDDKYSDETERRIGGITYHNNTRLGAAVRHAAARVRLQDARTRLLIVLSDGRPYDHDYGDARYAREDTREALKDARLEGINCFCITIDRDSETELRDLYGEIGYTIIDDVLSLPERLPAIYRRLTT